MPRHNHHGTIFTTLAIGLLIVIVMILIANPGIKRARATIERRQCGENLALIDAAKERYAVDHDLKNGSPVTLESLLKDGKILTEKTKPFCPGGGAYTINPLGVAPTCSLGPSRGHRLPGGKAGAPEKK